MNTRGGSSVGRASGLHPEGRRFDPCPLHQVDNMADDLEKAITHVILQILLEAKAQGKDMLTFEEILDLMGMDDKSLMTKFERESMFILNKDMLEKLEDPDVIEAMVESLGKLKH